MTQAVSPRLKTKRRSTLSGSAFSDPDDFERRGHCRCRKLSKRVVSDRCDGDAGISSNETSFAHIVGG